MSLKDAIREAVDARDKPEMKAEAPHEDQPETKVEDAPASSKAVKQASHKAVKAIEAPMTGTTETAAMTVRVSRRHRLHWLIAAKKEGTSLTAAITEALNARFGEPSD